MMITRFASARHFIWRIAVSRPARTASGQSPPPSATRPLKKACTFFTLKVRSVHLTTKSSLSRGPVGPLPSSRSRYATAPTRAVGTRRWRVAARSSMRRFRSSMMLCMLPVASTTIATSTPTLRSPPTYFPNAEPSDQPAPPPPPVPNPPTPAPAEAKRAPRPRRWPPDATGADACRRRLPSEPRPQRPGLDPAERHLAARLVAHDEPVAVAEPRLDLIHVLQVHEGRFMRPEEHLGVEPLLE